MKKLTTQDVTDWLAGKADERVSRRIEEELETLDSKVKEYLDWMGSPKDDRSPKRPTPELVLDYIRGIPELTEPKSLPETDSEGKPHHRIGPRNPNLPNVNNDPEGRGKP